MKRVTVGFLSCTALSVVISALGGCRRETPPEPQSVQAEPVTTAPPATPSTTPAAEATPATPASGAASEAMGSAPAAASAAPEASAAAAPSATAAVVIPPGHHKVVSKPVAPIQASPDDPLHGKFSLEDATHGLAGKGPLVAEIKTDAGTLTCQLYDDKAPLTVANFVGLARGTRPFKNQKGEWTKTPGYDGTTFHRIIKGFMIQGGDPAGTGAGEPGYVIPDEIWEDAYHSERGLICMANRGPNTNGMQFFIMDGSSPHLDGGYTIFGKCGPDSVIEKLANSEVQGDHAVSPPKIQKVTIRHGKAAVARPVVAGHN